MTTIAFKPVSNEGVSKEMKAAPVRENYLHRLSKLVAHIFSTFSKISQNDRQEISRLEQKYTLATLGSADATRSRGNLSLMTAFGSLFLFTTSFAFKTSDRDIVRAVSQKVPDFTRLFDVRYEAHGEVKKSMANLELQKLQEKNSRSQSEGNTKDQFAQVLQAEIQRMRSASASGG